MNHLKTLIINERYDEYNQSEQLTVENLIEELKKCDPKAKVYYTRGGSGNYGPITYIEQDTHFKDENIDDSYERRVIIGKLTW